MDKDRWQRIRTLFDSAAELPREEWRPYLDRTCQDDPSLTNEVLEMLEQDSRGRFILDTDVAQLAANMLRVPFCPAFQEFGPYRVKRLLGEGGMGVVFLAERVDFGNQVAIKVLRDAQLSPERLRRFAAEQRTLAQLNHPSIARLYDADTLADGTPWFVMEYIDGLPLDQYCAEHKCSIETRLKLFRTVCEAVDYAHQHRVVHRDLKPSNILVKQDGSVRLLDFGIAQRHDSEGTIVDRTRTGLRLLTPAYAAPEQVRGEPAGVYTDVYSLGVILYRLLTSRLPYDLSSKSAMEAAAAITTETPQKPSFYAETRTASWADLDVLVLRAMHREPQRRYSSVASLIRDVDHYLNHEPLEARPDSVAYRMGKFARRNWQTITAVALTAAVLLFGFAFAPLLRSKIVPARAKPKTVAVLPFPKSATNPDLDFLSFAIPEEIARVLGYAQSLSVRSFENTRRYAGFHADPQEVGRELHVGTIVTGDYNKGVDQLQIVLTAMDVETGRYFWRETFRVPARNAIELQAQIAAKTRENLGPLLGATEFKETAHPKNEEAYDLFLRATALGSDPADVKRAIQLLRKSLDLDSTYSPAWSWLAVHYRLEGWYSDGGAASLDQAEAAAERAFSLDRNNVDAARGLIVSRTGRGKTLAAYQEATDFLKRRPDNDQAHFALGYVFRYVGLLEEAERECDAAFEIDPLDAGNRSCGIPFTLDGKYRRAMDFINLDSGSEWARTFILENLLRQGKANEALTAGPKNAPRWAAYDVFYAALNGQSGSKIDELARDAKPEGDAEANYLAAAHLAYAGESEAALRLLSSAIQGGYCSYPAIDSDPLFVKLRNSREFARIRSMAIDCQRDFLTRRVQ